MSKDDKLYRIMTIFFKGLKGQDISVSNLADMYGISKKTVSRDMANIKAFFDDNRELVGNTNFEYSHTTKSYRLYLDEFLLDKELLALIKILIGSRALSRQDMLSVTGKLRNFASLDDRELIDSVMKKEIYNYNEVHCDCRSIIDMLWHITNIIKSKKEITITYLKMNRNEITRRILPASVMFSEYYFYMIAFHEIDGIVAERFYRLDRIINLIEHRSRKIPDMQFNEGELRKYNQFMFAGKKITVTFEFKGLSVQAVLDRIPTAKVIAVRNGVTVIEAEAYSEGIKMFLLSQGSWVKVLSPEWFAAEIKEEAKNIYNNYAHDN